MEGKNKNSQHISIIYTKRRKPACKLEHLSMKLGRMMEERKKPDFIICHSMHQKEETRETRKYHTSPVVKFKHTHK